MKRSQINRLIGESILFLDEMNFKLPPWGYWTPETWKENRARTREIIYNQLGWDLTDFGSGRFESEGLVLFTLRNGNPSRDKKPYAEKIMVVDEGQLTPLHFHWSKMEDIINRGGGNLMLELYASGENEELSVRPFDVTLDGLRKGCSPGETVKLQPGESITLYPGLYHMFYGESGHGKVLVGEVSAVNDDSRDNRFYEDKGRFPDIEEDETPRYLLVSDYKNILL
jgi:D-lyxose ketol-isomerase